MNSINKNLIPEYVTHVTEALEKAGFDAYLVGGCVRDLIVEREPKDWDVTTNAKPEEIIQIFEKTVYENTFGTVGVCVPRLSAKALASADETDQNEVSYETEKYNIIEVTPYRIEAKYSDFRHPDEVRFSEKLEDDLKRRDFTINALAYRDGAITDIYDGIKDIENKVIRTVGDPDERFNEDALRMLRAIRFSVQLGFTVSHETTESIIENANLIKNISAERIRDEFEKIIMSENPSAGILMLQKFGLLKYIIPELEEGIGCEQSGEHIYDVWNHLLHALQHAAEKNYSFEVRVAALFHDIGKPRSRRLITGKSEDKKLGPRFSSPKLSPTEMEARPDHNFLFSDFPFSKKKFTFYGHEVVGAKIVKKILERLKFPKAKSELIEKLIRNHMFFSDTEKITLSAVRRIIVKAGKENIWKLMEVRECDRVGMKKKEAPYRLRKYFAMIEEALHDPISVAQLKINGEDLINDIKINPSPRIGWILHALLEEVIEDPKKNIKEKLIEIAKKLDQLSDKELKILGEKGKEKKEELEEEEIKKLHDKHNVKK